MREKPLCFFSQKASLKPKVTPLPSGPDQATIPGQSCRAWFTKQFKNKTLGQGCTATEQLEEEAV
jgi:hypothetical protein